MSATESRCGASLTSAGTAPGWARASAGSATIGASVPSKSSATIAWAGSSRSAARPAAPAAVAGSGRPTDQTLQTLVARSEHRHEGGELAGRRTCGQAPHGEVLGQDHGERGPRGAGEGRAD